MQNPIKDMNNMDFTCKIFNCVRLIDLSSKSLVFERIFNSSMSRIPQFNFCDREELYKQSLQSNSVSYKLEQQADNSLFIAVLPENGYGSKCVIECIANITGSIEQIIQSNLHESAYLLSVTDELTGIYNRRYINHCLPQAISMCAENNVPLSIIFTDLDYFKDVNDIYGHEAGDYFLSQFAAFLQQIVHGSANWVARYGGDEFLLCLIGADNESAKLTADIIRAAIEKMTISFNGKEIKTTCSMGIYTLDDFAVLPTSDSVLKKVDKQLYQAKSFGRNTIR